MNSRVLDAEMPFFAAATTTPLVFKLQTVTRAKDCLEIFILLGSVSRESTH